MSSQLRSIALAAGTIAALSPLSAAQRTLFKAFGPASDEHAGIAVSYEGVDAFVGTPFAHHGTDDVGSVAILRLGPGAGPWGVVGAIFNPMLHDGDQFGASVSTAGPRVAVGAPYADTPASDSGFAYVFIRTTAGYALEGPLVSPSNAAGDRFGSSVACLPDVAVVGAPGVDMAAADSGAAFVYRRSGTSWANEAALMLGGASGGDEFGCAAALAPDRIAVGARSRSVGGVACGTVSVFGYLGGVWNLEAELAPSPASVGAHFGECVDLDGERLIVGAPGEDAAYLFERSPSGTWSQAARLEGIPTITDRFGSSVALKGVRAVIGAPKDCRVDVFRIGVGGVWRRSERFFPDTGSSMDEFGLSVAFAPDTLIVGSPGDDVAGGNAGAAYVLESPSFADGYGYADPGTCPCSNEQWLGGCDSGSGLGAILRVEGSGSRSADDLVFRVIGMPSGAACRLVMGDGITGVPMANGVRRVKRGSEAFQRLAVGSSDPSGAFSMGPGLFAGSPAMAAYCSAGETWNFQCWFRDPTGPCGGSSNFSNGVAVHVAP